jgi:hypothetical protein
MKQPCQGRFEPGLVDAFGAHHLILRKLIGPLEVLLEKPMLNRTQAKRFAER